MAGDKQIRAVIMQPRQALELTKAEAWQLLGSVSLGRVVFTMHALPAIRPVNHLIDDEAIIIRSHLGSAIVARAGLSWSIFGPGNDAGFAAILGAEGGVAA